MKRAAVEIQFNWILVLIAGVFIFLFFFSLITWAKKHAEESSSVTLSSYIDAILTAASIRKDTVNKVDLPIEAIELSCEGYRINEAKAATNFRNKVVFAPSRLEGKQVITWAVAFDAPFRVMNFLMVSSPDVRYIIRGDPNNEIMRYLMEYFPKELTPEFNPASVTDLNHKKVRVIYVGVTVASSDAEPFKAMPSADMTALKIDGDLTSGTITFYSKNPPLPTAQFMPGGSMPYYSTASLMASIFSEKSEEYDCGMRKALARLNKVAQIYSYRSNTLSVQGSLSCKNYHSQAKIQFDALTALSDMNVLNAIAMQLESINQNTQRNSCALLY